MKITHYHLPSFLLCLLGLIPGMAFVQADGVPKRSPELQVLDHYLGVWDVKTTIKPAGGEEMTVTCISRRSWTLGGVDEQAKVWFNGQLLGASADAGEGLPGTAGTFLPFEFNVTKEARVSDDNTIVVKVTNKRLDEVGTGGIVSPVMLWSPKR